MAKSRRLVVVEWYDACLFDGTVSYEGCLKRKMPIYKTYGILINKDKTTLRVACEETGDGEAFRQLNAIPVGSVISIKTLR